VDGIAPRLPSPAPPHLDRDQPVGAVGARDARGLSRRADRAPLVGRLPHRVEQAVQRDREVESGPTAAATPPTLNEFGYPLDRIRY
jgi:hypothetical protein